METLRPHARRFPVILVLGLVLAALLASAAAPGAAAATTYSVRLEAGPHPALAFSSTWAVTGSKSTTLTDPTTVTASRRVAVPNRGVQLKIASGALAGYWVPEGRVSYVPGVIDSIAYSPAQSVSLAAGTKYELYRFDAAGKLLEAKGFAPTVATTADVDRKAVIDGRRYAHLASGDWAGWWMPGSWATPSRMSCVVNKPPTGTSGRKVASLPTAVGEIALTFDMGGRLDPALSIVRYLELERICTTLFPTGQMASSAIGQQVMAEVKAHPELFELGNHTMHHCNLRDGGGGSSVCPATRPSDAFVAQELQDANAVFQTLSGRGSVPFWRPPYGAVDSALVTAAANAGFPYTMMWSTDTIDWKPIADGGPNAAQIAAKVVAGRTAGGIVLMHLGGYHTRSALPAMVDGLRAAGYSPTSLTGLWR
jgi:peptidoglycan/xylan/chitin deacetylase (PgdA/CDA1 family)